MSAVYQKLEQLLTLHGKKTIFTEELQRALGVPELAELYRLIQEAEERGLLQGIKRSGQNGNLRFPLYQKYRILSQAPDNTRLLEELLTLHPRLLSSGWLQAHPRSYGDWKEPLTQLSEYLFRQTGAEVPVSRKERSFAIFHQEKLLDNKGFWGLLRHLGLSEGTLGFYDTPENCLFDYISQRKDRLCLLVCENKDIWFNLRRMLFEYGRSRLWGEQIDGVVYGEGNHIAQPELLTQYTRFLGTPEVRYLYWGDIDREGLRIYLRTRDTNPDLSIRLFGQAYAQMLEHSEHIPLPDSEDRRAKMPDLERLRQELSQPVCQRLFALLEENRRLPQEIITFADLLEQMR